MLRIETQGCEQTRRHHRAGEKATHERIIPEFGSQGFFNWGNGKQDEPPRHQVEHHRYAGFSTKRISNFLLVMNTATTSVSAVAPCSISMPSGNQTKAPGP